MAAPDPGRVAAAHADAWQAEGRLRRGRGGDAASRPGARLMASGIPVPWWNGADVGDPSAFDAEAVAAWYAERRLPYGLRVPAAAPWPGRPVTRLRLMAAVDVSPAPPVAGLALALAGPDDLDAVVAVDAAAFDADADLERRWIAPRLDAAGVETVLGCLDGEPVATAHAVCTDEQAGPCVYLGGVAVVPAARRRGVGAAVSAWLVGRAFDAGARLAHLHATGEAAARLYARLGFADAGELAVYEAGASRR